MARGLATLTLTEQKHVRTALHNLRRRIGVRAGWFPIARALGIGYDTVKKCAFGERPVLPHLAFALARLLGVSIDDLIEGRILPGACPKCGHVPDFADEDTIVEDRPRPLPGLKIVK